MVIMMGLIFFIVFVFLGFGMGILFIGEMMILGMKLD